MGTQESLGLRGRSRGVAVGKKSSPEGEKFFSAVA